MSSNMSTGQWIGTIVGAVVGFFTGGSTWYYTAASMAQGAAVGNAVGGALDPPKGPNMLGPRLSDLGYQTSTYGANLPRIYGATAVFGNVFWLEGDKLKEVARKKKSGGKGGGGSSTTTFSYFATFALGLCHCPSGPIAGVRRIWASGKLIYDAGSDDQETMAASNQAAKGFRIYYGTDDQLPDPRMEADKGVGNVSGHPGRAYIVFYDFKLADYGNSLAGVQIKVEVVTAGAQQSGETVLLMHMDGGAADACGHTVSIDQTILDNDWIQFGTQRGPFGGRADFTGMVTSGATTPVPARAIVVANSTDFEIGDASFTLEATASGTAYPVSSTAILVGYGLSPTQPSLRAFRFEYNHAGDLIFAASGLDGDLGITAPGVISNSDDLNRYAVTRDASGVGRLFVNGAKVAEGAMSGYIRNASGNSVNYPDMYVGSQYQGGSRVGTIDEVRLVVGMALYTDDYTPLPIPADVWGFQNLSADQAVLGDIVLAECLQSRLLTIDDIDVSDLTDIVQGYRISSTGSIRAAIEPLLTAYPCDVIASGYKIKFVRRGNTSAVTIPIELLDARADGDTPAAPLTISREMETQLPRLVRVSHIDYEREYDDGVQASPERVTSSSDKILAVEVPVVMTAAQAAQTAEVLNGIYWMERNDLSFKLPPVYAQLQPADVVTITSDTESHELRLTAISYLPDGRLECAAKYNSVDAYQAVSPGEPGSVTPPPTIGLAGPSAWELLDIPALTTDMNTPIMVGAMTGYTTGWPGGILYRSTDGGQTWGEVQGWSEKCTIGYARNAIGSQPAERFDITSQLQADFYGGEPESVTQLALLNGANHFAYGVHGRWEIIAARTVTLQADGSYTLQDMLRGRFGTEHNRGNHAVGDALILLTDLDLAFIAQDSASIGLSRLWRGVTLGADIDSTTDTALSYGAVNLKPLSPVYAKGHQDRTSGDWSISWVRRTRIGGEWRDLVDASLGEASEAYEIDVCTSDFATVKRTLSVTSAAASYTSAQQTTDFGAEQETLYLRIYQISAAVGRGYALQVTLTQPQRYWTPDLIATQLWLDAADSSSITLVSGAVSQWNDKSGNGRHVTQGTAANRPAYPAAVLNGLNVVRFDGSNDKLTRNTTLTGLAQNVGAMTIIAVYAQDAVPTPVDTTAVLYISAGGGSTASRAWLGTSGFGKAFVGGRRLDADSFASVAAVGNIATGFRIQAVEINYASATASVYVDGVSVASGAFQTAGTTSNTTPTGIAIGSDYASTTNRIDGDIFGVLAFHSVDAGTRQKAEGYFAHLCDLTANLPSDHPYKTNPPEA